jgi:predicted transcriptional regulator
LLVEQDTLRAAHLTKLRSALADGLAQADRGELLDGDQVRYEMRELLRERQRSAKTT